MFSIWRTLLRDITSMGRVPFNSAILSNIQIPHCKVSAFSNCFRLVDIWKDFTPCTHCYTHHTVLYTLHYTPQFKLHISLYIAHITIYCTQHCTLAIHYIPHCTLTTKLYTIYNTIHWTQHYTLYTTLYTGHSTIHYTPHYTQTMCRQ